VREEVQESITVTDTMVYIGGPYADTSTAQASCDTSEGPDEKCVDGRIKIDFKDTEDDAGNEEWCSSDGELQDSTSTKDGGMVQVIAQHIL
jgi:hypothetical protein